MTKIYLIRHAEAEGNIYRRVQGHHDGKVTLRGYKQIAALAERFKDIHIDAVYASDLSRTQETAGAILKYHDLPLGIDLRLKEVNMGVWENMTWGDIGRDDPRQLACFSGDPDNWHVPGSESFRHLGDRVMEAVTQLGAKHDGETIVLVSHGMAIRAFHCRVLGIPSREVQCVPHGDNTCVSLYTLDGDELTPVFRNDNSHLTDDISTILHQSWWRTSSGKDSRDLRFEQLDLIKDREYYTDCYADAWKTIHGTLKGFDENAYVINAKLHAGHPGCLVKVCAGEETIGIVELDMDRGEKEGYAWISFFYLDEAHRGQGLAPQLLGHAVNMARGFGRARLRLNVAECNERAIGFYKHFGFSQIGANAGALCLLKQMEMILP